MRTPLTVALAAGPSRSWRPAPAGTGYVPGVCNIGPAEIARRRRSGIAASIATILLLAALLVIHAAVPFRLLVFLPAAVAAAGFLQAWLKFCAGFGWLGEFNFRGVGTTETVASADARRRDRAMAIRIGLASAVVGGIVAGIAVLLPV
jgi:hypothetical protein